MKTVQLKSNPMQEQLALAFVGTEGARVNIASQVTRLMAREINLP